MVAPAPRKETRKERCARCGLVISRRRTPFVWHDHIVCEHCQAESSAPLEPAMALQCPGAKTRGSDSPAERMETPQSHMPVGRWVASMGRRLVGKR